VLKLPLPAIPNAEMMMGGVGLTASAGIAGWIEFLLLRGAMVRRVGPVKVERSYLLRLWLSAGLAAVIARVFARYALPQVISHLPVLSHVIGGALVAGIFGVIYFTSGLMLGVPEARATLGRVIPQLRRR
jgi:putative peptidoglycan lipid II flippase